MKIVSLFPAATEIICAAGLGDQLIGVSHLCDYPPRVRGLPKVTQARLPGGLSSAEVDSYVREHAAEGLFTLDVERLLTLAPDTIISQSLCDLCAVPDHVVREACSQLTPRPRVLTLSPHRIDEVFDSIEEVAALGPRSLQAHARLTVHRLRQRVEAIAERNASRSVDDAQRRRVLLLEWLDPPFTAGHWNPELIAMAGGQPVLSAVGERSRQISWQRLLSEEVDLIVFAACGIDLTHTASELNRMIAAHHPIARLIQQSRYGAWIVDGNQYFNRPGPRLVDATEWLAQIIARPDGTATDQISSFRIPSGSLGILDDAALRRPTR
ncbi:MAG: cobalamin-binding protein [Pirellulaceae bacterium]|nr:MAG: cobalamin-binding protein [Pirellulaceae bacterium]